MAAILPKSRERRTDALRELADAPRALLGPEDVHPIYRKAGKDEDWAELSTRTSNALRREGFATPADAARLSDDALLLVDGLGKRGLWELRDHDWNALEAVGARDGDVVETGPAPKPDSDRILKLLADSYEQSQQIRIGRGEQIRAVLQDRDETWGVGGVRWMEERYGPAATADQVLDFIGKTGEAGPVPILGRMYHRAYTEERELYREMVQALKGHVCWPWLSQVKGIGATLSCKLLARLDPHKAPSASSFWSYCGMGTVPGERYACGVCGLVRDWPVGYNVTGKHTALGSTRQCAGALMKIADPEHGVRAAQPKPARGQKASYDQYAKKVMYLVGTGFVKAKGGKFEQVYRKERAKLDRERPGWPDGRKHLTALRKVEKLFLSLLWEVWRKALGLPTPAPYAFHTLGHDESSRIDPWEMVG